eukprot:TCALIF_03130-PB protein Name:"Similar to Asap2 Arf-GAP with SH3 domain, ANK repeat and PH domain-containing protein 2 (Mus musculus)" AED:0.23 eAED:0.23 QI:0/0.83/0.71/1/0.66/0.71/7/921/476
MASFGEASHHGVDITDPLPSSEFAETSLHHAISHETGHSLHIVDFLVQNSSSLDKQTREGNTPLHYCVIQNQCESMRLLLRSGANPQVENNNGKTPIDIAKERGHALCEEMLMHSLHRKKTMFDNVNIDWHLTHEDGSTDFSDDEMLEDYPRLNGSRTPEHLLSSPDRDAHLRTSSRPYSVYHSSTTPNRGSLSINRSSDWISDRGPTTLSTWNKSTSETGDSPRMHHHIQSNNMPPPPPPQSKKPGGLFSSSNITPNLMGSLKKGSKQTLSLPSTAYNTLPSQHHLRSSTSSPRFIPNNHKRSPSSDSGHGTLHNPMMMSSTSRSNTPVSYHGGKVHHTVFLHVGPQSGAGSDTSPPLKNFADDSSPETAGIITRMKTSQSTESLDSLSDESGSHLQRRHARSQLPQHGNFPAMKRCRALYDCEADNDDELSFEEGNIILILNEETEDENWMEGMLESQPTKRGLFPVSFVHILE